MTQLPCFSPCFFVASDARVAHKALKRGNECGCEWFVVSPFGTAGGGVGWFAALLRHHDIGMERAIIHCGTRRGMVLEALAAGFKTIVCVPSSPALRSLAAAYDATLLSEPPVCDGCRQCRDE